MTSQLKTAQAAIFGVFDDYCSWSPTKSLYSEGKYESSKSTDEASYTKEARTYTVGKVTPDDTFDDINFMQSPAKDPSSGFTPDFTFTEVVDENTEKLNKLRDYYKSNIRELPPVFITAAAAVSNASMKASSDGRFFKYKDTIELQEKPRPHRNARKRSIDRFNPPFNSTTNDARYGVRSDSGTESMCSSVTSMSTSTEKRDNTTVKPRKLSWIDYVKDTSSSYKINRSKSSNSSKCLQTVLTMENVEKLSEMLKTSSDSYDYLGDKVHNAETYQLSKHNNMQASCKSTSTECTSSLCSDNYDLNVRELTDIVRARVVNWLVKLDDYTGGRVVALQCAVRFLDDLSSVCCGTLPDSVLVCAAACFWVAAKLQSARAPGAACVVRHSAGAFTAAQLVACERRVLALLAFPSAPLLPADETERLAQACGADDELAVVEGAHYLCCCALLHTKLATTSATTLAVAALTVSARNLVPDHPVNQRLLALRDGAIDYTDLERSLEGLCRAVSAPACACREPFLRYSSRRCRAVALHFTHTHTLHVYSDNSFTSV